MLCVLCDIKTEREERREKNLSCIVRSSSLKDLCKAQNDKTCHCEYLYL